MFDHTTVTVYNQARDRGRWGQVSSALIGRSRPLIALAEIDAACTVHTHRKEVLQWLSPTCKSCACSAATCACI